MIFKEKKHSVNLYNTLLYLSRNIFFYRDLQLEDNYETRIYLMFFHYSIILYIMKQRGNKPDQVNYNNLFFNIENNLRELGFGDVSVNKIFYDILIKFNDSSTDFKLNKNLITKYFVKLKDNDDKFNNFSRYFSNFYTFCFEIPSENMIHNTQKYKF